MPMSVPADDQPAGQAHVLRRGLGIAGRVVVEQDERRGARHHRLLEDLARVHEARGQAADRDHGLALDAMADVEGEEAEGLDRARGVARQQVARGVRRGAQHGLAGPSLGGEAGAQLERGQHAGRLGAAEAVLGLEVAERALGQAADARRRAAGPRCRAPKRAREPVPSSSASSSRLDRAAAPWRARRSRGRSSSAHPRRRGARPRPRLDGNCVWIAASMDKRRC